MQAPDLIHKSWNFIQQLFALDPQEPFKNGAKVATIVGAVLAVAATLITKTYPWLRAKIESRSVSKILGEDLFTPTSIERAVRYYIPPLCQSIDPAGGEESRLIHSVQAPLFEAFDKATGSESEEKYHILLADSGMGKSSAVTNYCVRHQRRWRKKYYVAMVPLGIPDADERIKRIENKSETSLFLDALDEDTLAMVDHVERMRLLIRDTHEFRKVVITCRTQFFSNDEEIPRETGVLKITVRSAGESAERLFYKIYLAPFSDAQVKAYLKRRYPLWQWKSRQQAFRMVSKIPLLSARPMLLAHIDDLVRIDRSFHFSYELYEEMVEAWIKREQGFVENSEALREFSEHLAVDLYCNRGRRGAEWIRKEELGQLANEWKTPIIDQKLSGRSLLNRDAEGNFKFAHRSIMEYLFVQGFLHGEAARCVTVEWTDQMRHFLWEMFQSNVKKTPAGRRGQWFDLPPLTPEQEVSLLCGLLAYSLQTLNSRDLEGLGSLSARAMLVLLDWLLDPEGTNNLRVGLWRCHTVMTGPQTVGGSGVFVDYQLLIDQGLSYSNGLIVSEETRIHMLLSSRGVLSNNFPIVGEGNALEFYEKLRGQQSNVQYGMHLASPIFIGGVSYPRFVLLAQSARIPFFRDNVTLLLETVAPFRRPT